MMFIANLILNFILLFSILLFSVEQRDFIDLSDLNYTYQNIFGNPRMTFSSTNNTLRVNISTESIVIDIDLYN